jgi:Mn2+/Fe2+ NRAMP family transporter
MKALLHLPRHARRTARGGRTLLKALGPGLITGAADDDPSGITTYTQAGAQLGLGSLWMAVLTLPLMIGIQLVSARIGWASGRGIAANARAHLPRGALWLLVGALAAANTINLGADLSAMASVAELAFGGASRAWLLGFAAFSLALQVFLPFPRYAPLLKAMTLSLLAYVGVTFTLKVPWLEVARASLVPTLAAPVGLASQSAWLLLVAVLGTTISPYLFFWQASHEAEQRSASDARRRARGLGPRAEQEEARWAQRHLQRIRLDTVFGMLLSNAIAFFVMLAAALTLHAHGIDDVQTTAQAASALRPIAGDFAFVLFALGIIGTGLLAVPVLAGSAAYALAEAFGWPASLQIKPGAARGFYGALIAAVLIGVGMDFYHLDPVQELLWSAVINGLAAVPIMVMVLWLAQRPAVMGQRVISPRLSALGWTATAAMGAASLLFVADLLHR